MFKKNDKIELHITDISIGGEGIGKSDGFPFFVKNAVIGDTVEAVVTKVNKRYGFAKVLQVKEPSPWRVVPACTKAEQCGGCQIMQLSYEKQLEFKEKMVKNNLQRIGGVVFEESRPGPSAQFFSIIGMHAEDAPLHFRNKVQFPVGRNKDGHVITGFYAGRTHYIIETDTCPVSNRVNARILKVICEFLEAHDIPVYDETDGSGLVRHVLIRNGFRTGQIMVCLVINGNSLNEARGQISRKQKLTTSGSAQNAAQLEAMTEDLDQMFARTLLAAFAADSPDDLNTDLFYESVADPSDEPAAASDNAWTITSISLNVNRKNTNVILGEEIIPLYGKPFIEDRISLNNTHEAVSKLENQASFEFEERLFKGTETLKDLTFHISPLSFYQVNPAQTEKLYAKALEFADLTGKETVWDLYCGIGTISLFLAQKAKQVYGVEIVPDAIRDAKINAELNGIENAAFYCGDSATIFSENVENADVVVLDPPRKGCDDSLLEAVKKVGPDKIVYVSCDSATLARDLKILSTPGETGFSYQVQKVQPVDMFPHTYHVETVCLLSNRKRKPDSCVKVSLDMEDYYKIKDEQRAKEEAE